MTAPAPGTGGTGGIAVDPAAARGFAPGDGTQHGRGPATPAPEGGGGDVAAQRGIAPAERYAELAALDDVELGARLLADTPTHEGRDPERLRAWARIAIAVGTEMADDATVVGAETTHGPMALGREVTPARGAGPGGNGADPQVVKSTGGLGRGEVLLAEYRHRARGGTVVLYTDALDYASGVAEAAGWAADFPPEAVRAAALDHERAHRLLHGSRGRELRRRLDHTAAAIGRLRIRGHVVGADEIAAHAYARRRGRMRRSPLLLTAAIAETLAHAGPPASAAPAPVPFPGGSA
ncbi:hypothetical protein ACFOVU_12665 [Nocardiopsis sediminis]|uniref:DUF2786 domain-containing protein n=1 Tax=Nocardiopsis sediminis TaxID=1778267 RepID=A0ABV8FKV2_9ACTN